jgi:hypothetical protein
MFKHLKKTRKFYENILNGSNFLPTSFSSTGNNNVSSENINVLNADNFKDAEVDKDEYDNFKNKMPEKLKNLNFNEPGNEKEFRNFYGNNPAYEKFLNLLKIEMQPKPAETSLGEYFKKSALMKLIYEKKGDDRNLDEELGDILSGGGKKNPPSKKNSKGKKEPRNKEEEKDEDLEVPDDMEDQGNFRNLTYLKYCKALYYSCINRLINREQLKNYYRDDTRTKIYLTYPQILLEPPVGNDEEYCEEAVNFISAKIGENTINSLSPSEIESSKENPPSLEKLDNEILQKFSNLFYRALNKTKNLSNSIKNIQLKLPTYQSLFQSEESGNSFLDQIQNYLPEDNVIEVENNPPRNFVAR